MRWKKEYDQKLIWIPKHSFSQWNEREQFCSELSLMSPNINKIIMIKILVKTLSLLLEIIIMLVKTFYIIFNEDDVRMKNWLCDYL